MSITDLFSKQTPPRDAAISRIPGKLFISGEYAILKEKQTAILVAVDQYLTCRVSGLDQFPCEIHSDYGNLDTLIITFNDKQIDNLSTIPSEWAFVYEGLKVAYEVLIHFGITLRPFHMDIRSDLAHQNGRKYGLGSSGAVTVAVIQAFLKFHGLLINTPLTLFKLAVLATLRQGSNGSMADLATICTGGWVYYQTFDHHQIYKWINDSISLEDWLCQDWPDLKIESLQVPDEYKLLIGWTGTPASTQSLVSQLKKVILDDSLVFDGFCAEMRNLVPQLKRALITKNGSDVCHLLEKNHHLLKQLSEYYQLPILTSQLNQLIEDAQHFDAGTKLSGAGGGDCGIAITIDPASETSIKKHWYDHQIVPLEFKVTNSLF